MMDYYKYLDGCIEKLLKSPLKSKMQKPVIYPFGQQGMLLKEILNFRYGIEEAFIIDERLYKVNDRIKSIEYLEQINVDEFFFLIASDNLDCYEEIRNNISKYVESANTYDFFSKKRLYTSEPRVASLELASREIYNRGIDGSVAEAGVYQGDFAQYINKFFPDRKLYLFDTFEGFVKCDVEIEHTNGFSYRNEKYLGDTCENDVMKKMINDKQVVIKKGYFPDTTQGLYESFCFVSLDMDLYIPMKAGLEYFYPRLNGGGYIFVHDCCIGAENFRGARAALLEFCSKSKVGYVMLPDHSTAVITKALE